MWIMSNFRACRFSEAQLYCLLPNGNFFFKSHLFCFYLPSSVEITFTQFSPQTHSHSVLLYVFYFYNPSPFDFFSYPTFKNVPFIFFSCVSVISHTFLLIHYFLSFPLFFLSIFSTFSFFSLSLSFLFFLIFLRCCRKVLH